MAGREVTGNGDTTCGIDPATDAELEPAYSLLDEAQLAEAAAATEDDFATAAPLLPVLERKVGRSGPCRHRTTGEVRPPATYSGTRPGPFVAPG